MYHCICSPVTDEIIRRDLEQALNELPLWRREKALSYRFDRDRYVCAKAYLLLKELLEKHYGISGDVEFEYGPYGKPFLKADHRIHFNISHCPKAVLCAVGDADLGVDVEEVQFDEDVARKVFSESELESIRSAKSTAIRFTELWTMKEAFLKLQGIGLVDDIKTILDHPNPPVEFRVENKPDMDVVSCVAVYQHFSAGERFINRKTENNLFFKK